MKKVLLTALLGIVSAVGANAGTEPALFDVTATLSAKCENVTPAGTKVNFGVYTPYAGPATAAPTATIQFRCTKGLAPVAALDAAGGTLLGISYTVGVGADTVTDDVPTGGKFHSFVVTGGMTGGMAGDTAAPATDTRTLTITY